MVASDWKRRAWWGAIAGFIAGLVSLALGVGSPAVLADPPGAHAPQLPTVRPLFRARHPKAVAPTSLSEGLAGKGLSDPETHRALRDEAWGLPASAIDIHQAKPVDGELVQALADGTEIVFTVDPALHAKADKILRYYRVEYGAIVAMNVRNGEILALGEHARNRPGLRHLALQAEGPAASIFKIVTAAALLEQGDLRPEDKICTHGGRRRLSLRLLKDNPKRDKHCTTFAKALGTSNNVAFARWADRRLKPKALQKLGERFAFGQRLPFIHGVAMSRIAIPTGSRLSFAKAAAGFLGTNLSPLHAVALTAAMGNRGEMMVPRLIRSARVLGKTRYTVQHESLAQIVQPKTAKDLVAMMTETTKRSGSAGIFFHKRRRGVTRPRIPGLTVAGKTGSLSSRFAGVAKHYSWFVALAPAENPQIAVAALVVNGKVWTAKGATLARDLLAFWHKRQQKR